MSSIAFSNNGRNFFSYTKRNNTVKKENRYNENSRENLNIGYANKGVSWNTKKKILIRCRALNYISEEKKVRDYKGEMISHTTSFVTLTLPSEQIHSDQEITKLILGKFLDRCRKLGILQNYVWKAEKQKNGNIHYHILTDSYINKTLIYRLWLLSLERLGYVTRYREKFVGMDLQEYSKQKFNENVKELVINKRFWKGKKNNWSSPPCFDNVNVSGSTGLENYMSKYISKDNGDYSLNVKGRVWGCSENLNKAVELLKNDEDFNRFGFEIAKFTLKSKMIITEYFEFVKMTFNSIFAWLPWIKEYIITKLREIVTPCSFHLMGQGVLF